MTTPKTGAEHLKSLKDGRTVYLNGKLVEDVTQHPAYRHSCLSAAALYDFQVEKGHEDEFIRLFEEFDVTVGTWIRKRRLAASCTDLADKKLTSLSITEIAMRHGFADASHFSHAFKDEYGMSPREYRRNYIE